MTTDTENTLNEAEATAELAKSEDATAYIEERTEQETVDRLETEAEATVRNLQEKVPELKEAKKASRYDRLKRARDQYKQEAEELRARLGQASETEAPDRGDGSDDHPQVEAKLHASLESSRHLHGEDRFDKAYLAFVEHCHMTRDQAAYNRIMEAADPGMELVQWWNEAGNPSASEGYQGPFQAPDSPSEEPYQAEVERGRQQQEFEQQLAARDAEIRVQTESRLRAEAFAAQTPDFHETMQSIDGVDELPPLMLDLIRRSPVGPQIAYAMAKDFWDPNSQCILDHAKTLAHDPIAQARFVGALEVVYQSQARGGGATQARTATKAPPPMQPVRGGSNAPKDLHSLAKSDSADDYIRARRSAS